MGKLAVMMVACALVLEGQLDLDSKLVPKRIYAVKFSYPSGVTPNKVKIDSSVVISDEHRVIRREDAAFQVVLGQELWVGTAGIMKEGTVGLRVFNYNVSNQDIADKFKHPHIEMVLAGDLTLLQVLEQAGSLLNEWRLEHQPTKK